MHDVLYLSFRARRHAFNVLIYQIAPRFSSKNDIIHDLGGLVQERPLRFMI